MKNHHPHHASSAIRQSAQALREAFDGAYAQVAEEAPVGVENLLAVRIAGEPYAIRVAEIAGLYADRRVVRLPVAEPALIGMASFRRRIAPVYDLARLLGCTAAAAPTWLVLARAGDVVALAFEAFEGHCSVTAEQLIGAGSAPATPSVLRGAVRAQGAIRPIVDLPLVLQGIQRLASGAQAVREPPTKDETS